MAEKDAQLSVLQEEAGETLVEWARANANRLAIGSIAVAVVLAGGLLWRASADKKDVNASAALAQAEGVAQSGNVALAVSDLQGFLRRYAGTKAAVQARMLLARLYFQQGKADSGLAQLDAVRSPGSFAAAFHALRGAGLEQSGKAAEAAAAYEAAAAASGSEAEKSGNLADAARLFVEAGQIDAAKKIWTAIANDDTNPMSGEAKVRLGELMAKS